MAASASSVLHDSVSKANVGAAAWDQAKNEAALDLLKATSRCDQQPSTDQLSWHGPLGTVSDHEVRADLRSKAPDPDDHVCLSTCLGQKPPHAKDPLQEAPRARASRHKLSCRKKTVMTANRPFIPASTSSPKRSRPAASPKQEKTGKELCLELTCQVTLNHLPSPTTWHATGCSCCRYCQQHSTKP